ncbi:hypothetical protein EP837_02053 [Sphingobium sp. EP60837]|nr:hypothetical protein EP837_02053 [Sphingobium sp. EP60837]
MRVRCDVESDLLEMHAHRLAVASGHDDGGGLAFRGRIAPNSHAEDRR